MIRAPSKPKDKIVQIQDKKNLCLIWEINFEQLLVL